jgi:hypothetical protein
VAKPKRKRKPGRKAVRVKIRGNPLAVIDRMLGRDGSSPVPPPRRKSG